MAELIPVYRYEVRREGAPAETRWSLVAVHPHRYVGSGEEPADAHPMSNVPADVGQMRLAGHVEAPDGTSVVSSDPPVLDIPGRGQLLVEALIGAGEGHAGGSGKLVRWRSATPPPAGGA